MVQQHAGQAVQRGGDRRRAEEPRVHKLRGHGVRPGPEDEALVCRVELDVAQAEPRCREGRRGQCQRGREEAVAGRD